MQKISATRNSILVFGLALLSIIACSPLHAFADHDPTTNTPTPFLPQTTPYTNTPIPVSSATIPPATPTQVITLESTPSLMPTSRLFNEDPITIGYSAASRRIEVYRFGTGDIEKLIIAGIHGGNEYNTIALALELIDYIEENPDVIPEDITLYILPNLNPDGAARGRGIDARMNENGVDLNRNWPFNWQAEWFEDGCLYELPTSAGIFAASEPETVTLMTFVRFHNIDAMISYHSAALGIFAGGIPDFPPSLRLAESLAAVSNYPYPPVDTGCLYTGNLADWAAKQGIAAVDIELTDHSSTDLWQNVRILRTFLHWVPPDE